MFVLFMTNWLPSAKTAIPPVCLQKLLCVLPYTNPEFHKIILSLDSSTVPSRYVQDFV